METLSSEFTVAQKKLEHEFTQFNKAMMAHELEPVLAFKESLEQAQGRMSDCRQALDNAIKRKPGDAEEIDYAFRDIAKSLESKTFEILHELGKRISLFERKSSVGGSVHSSKAATSVKDKSISKDNSDQKVDTCNLKEHLQSLTPEGVTSKCKPSLHPSKDIPIDGNTEHEEHASFSNLNAHAMPYRHDYYSATPWQRLPLPKPRSFSGDSLQFTQWRVSFETLMSQAGVSNDQKFYYLQQSLSGPALECIQDMFLLDSSTSYPIAMKRLMQRFGDPYIVSHAFHERLTNWARISDHDVSGLRKYSDFVQQCLVAQTLYPNLNILDHEKENNHIVSKLPDKLVHSWIRIVSDYKRKYGTFPSFRPFAEFLERESDIACDPVLSIQTINAVRKISQPLPKKKAVAHDIKATASKFCFYCQGEHYIYACSTFIALSAEKRLEYVSKENLCKNCLRKGHNVKKCQYKGTCKTCHNKHSSLLHISKKTIEKKEENVSSKVATDVNPQSTDKTSTVVSNFSSHVSDRKCSMIVPVYLSHKSNVQKEVLVYALLDTMSDTSFVSDYCLDKLNVEGIQVNLSLSTLSSVNLTVTSTKVSGLKVRGYYNHDYLNLSPLYSRNNIPANREHIPTFDKVKQWSHLQFLKNKLSPRLSCPIGLIIGYDNASALAPIRCTPSVNFAPYSQETLLGWTVVGCVGKAQINSTSHCMLSYPVFDENGLKPKHNSAFCFKTSVKPFFTPVDLSNILDQDFRDISNKSDEAFSVEDSRFMQIMKDNIAQSNGINFSMPLPFKSCERPEVPNNKLAALSRLNKLKHRLINDKEYFVKYSSCMDKLFELKHAEKVPLSEVNMPNHEWYLPHHGVTHARKPDKLRVVFDSSSKYGGISLNDLLLKGPDLTNSLIGVLLRFRKEQVALACDIQQMFYNFHVSDNFCDYLRFLFYEDNDLSREPTVFRMKTHAFGLTSSPSCANYALKQLASDYSDEYRDASEFLSNSLYIDDGLISLNSDQQALKLINEAVELCKKGGLTLHKFLSNSSYVMQYVHENYSSESTRELPGPDVERLLGVVWCVQSDTFQNRISIDSKPFTRRGILSTVSAIYDPLGFIGPFVLEGKRLLQLMCRENISWDEPISDELLPRWQRWLSLIPQLEHVSLKRCYKTCSPVKRAELHHFSDASSSAYGECSYLKLIHENGEVTCSLVMAKCRVAPLKPVSIPRLELTAAVVACKVSKLLNKELKMDDLHNYFWSDSQIVLAYIKNESKRFHVYVANRIQLIRDCCKVDEWHYIPTKENPADDASRGLELNNMSGICSHRWFCGPKFLHEQEVPTFLGQNLSLDDNDPEVKVSSFLSLTDQSDMLEHLTCFSSWFKAKRALANSIKICKFWYEKSVKKEQVYFQYCDVTDIESCQTLIVKWVQSKHFVDELNRLKHNHSVLESSRLTSLNPILSDGIIRVGGRLDASNTLSYEEMHPIILPSVKVCYISKLIILHFHEICKHQGRGITVNTIRIHGYWIMSLISSVAAAIHNCITCRKLYKNTMEQQMSNLPSDRVNEAPPFSYSAVDIFGPYLVKLGRKTLKRYAVLFTCLVCRAVHIEVANSLTTDSFINA